MWFAVGVIALALALAAHGELLVRLRQAEAAHPWWFGYARDGANLATALMLWGAYLMLGLPGPSALLAGMMTTLVTYLLDWLIARALGLKHPRLTLALPLVAWVALAGLRPDTVRALFASVLALGRP
jgi:hypothetical protein